jgi:GNAT superfamily N-acetyltransferase
MTHSNELVIREGKQDDINGIYTLVEELAIYHEQDPEYVQTTPEQLLEDGFGEEPFFHFYVAEEAGRIIGTAIYYFTYSTWKGKSLYLEDLIITGGQRGKGIGQAFIHALANEAVKHDVKKMKWQVSETNNQAIRFYERLDAELDEEWINCELYEEQLISIASQSSGRTN